MHTLRQTAPHWCFYKQQDTPEVCAARLKAMGYYALELVPKEWFTVARSAGLKVLNIAGVGLSAGLNRSEKHVDAVREVREAISLAHDNAIPHVLVFSGDRGELSYEQGIASCAKALSELAPHAQQAGVTLVLEALCAQDHPGYQADRSEFALAVVKRVESSAVKILYDIYHMHRMGENVSEVIERELHWIAHLHVAGSPKRDFPGALQEIDYQQIVRRALIAGYTGCWGQEFLPGPDIYADLEAARKLFDSYATTAQAPVAPTAL